MGNLTYFVKYIRGTAMKTNQPTGTPTITREEVKQNFSTALHTLASPLIFQKLNIFERKYVAQMLKRTKEPEYSTLQMQHFARVHNMYSKYVGYTK